MNFCEEKITYSISCQERNIYQLDLGYKTIDLTFCQLLSFRKKILALSTPSSLETILESDNFVLLFLADNKHLVYLDVPQILQLQKLVLTLFKKEAVAL